MSSSTADDDTKLKDIVIESLAGSGILSDFKSRLGLEIVKALETDLELHWGKDSEDLLPKSQVFENLEPELQTNEGILALYLVQDVLEKLGLHYSCRIFKTEIGGEWNLFRSKSKKDLKQILNSLNLDTSDTEHLSGTNFGDSSENGSKEKCIVNKPRPLLTQLIAKVLAGEVGTQRNSFSNETFVKSPKSVSSNGAEINEERNSNSAEPAEN